MRKRIIALLLAFTGIFTLVGCNEVKKLEKQLAAPVIVTSLEDDRLITWEKIENAQVYYIVKYVVNASGQIDGSGQADYANPLTECKFISKEKNVGKYAYRVYASAIGYQNSENSNQVILVIDEELLLEEAIPAAIAEINALVKLDDYEGDVKAALEAKITHYTKVINDAEDRATVATALANAKKDIKKIVDDAEAAETTE